MFDRNAPDRNNSKRGPDGIWHPFNCSYSVIKVMYLFLSAIGVNQSKMKAIYFVALLLGIGCTFAKGANLNCSSKYKYFSGKLRHGPEAISLKKVME